MKYTICVLAIFSLLLAFSNCNRPVSGDAASTTTSTAKTISPPAAKITTLAIQEVDGKCYATCLSTGRYVTEFEEIAMFTGNVKQENVDIEYRLIETPTNNPDNPTESKQYVILKDTSQSSNFIIRKLFVQKEATSKDQFTTKQIVCEKDVTPVLIGQIQQELRTQGYYDNPTNTSIMDDNTRIALEAFKKTKNLSCGDQLDIETMRMMGITSDNKYRDYDW